MKPKLISRLPVGFRFRIELIERLQQESDRTGLTKTKILEFALQRYLSLKRN